MAHFALICPPFFSHLRVFEVLGLELATRGHRATLLVDEAPGPRLSSLIAIRSLGSGIGTGAAQARAARPTGPLGILRTVADSADRTARLCALGPDAIAAIDADAIVGDQIEPAAGLIAAHLRLPHISVACGLPINAAPGIPPPFVGWGYDPSPAGVEWIAGGERVVKLLLSKQRRAIEECSARLRLPLRSTIEQCLSPGSQIAQISRAFDFPRAEPVPFAAVGRIREEQPGSPLEFALDPSRPFVFASLGTLQGGRLRLFRSIAKACRAAGAQLLVAHCGLLDERQAGSIGADHVTDFAPQEAVLARADLCITHAGLNTVLDSIAAGVPLLAVPIAFDQPGVAARIVHHGIGERVSPWRAGPAGLERLICQLLEKPSYRENLVRQQSEMKSCGGTGAAADLIEAALLTGGAEGERCSI